MSRSVSSKAERVLPAALEDLNFAAFRDFALTRPGVVDASLEMLRRPARCGTARHLLNQDTWRVVPRHLQIPLFGESGADKKEK